jgi:hypothetical protein
MMAKATTPSNAAPPKTPAGAQPIRPVATHAPSLATRPLATRPLATRPLDWRKRMSDTVAYALLVYTALQITVTMHALSHDSSSMLPLFALVVLVMGIIPLFRHYERRWELLDAAAAADPARKAQFRRDQVSVWLFAIGLPFAVTALFKACVSLVH